MITYKVTNNDLNLQPIEVPNYKRANDIAQLVVGMIRDGALNGETVTQAKLLHGLREKQNIHRYAPQSIKDVARYVLNGLEQQGFIEITEETLEQYLTEGKLTHNQLHNAQVWLTESKIFESHNVKGKRGFYSQEEEKVYGKIGDYVHEGYGFVKAIRSAVNGVLGEGKTTQFGIWYKNYVKERSAQDSESKIKRRVEELQTDPSSFGKFTASIIDYNALMRLYSTIATAPSQTKKTVLDKLVSNYSTQYPTAMKDYPFGLYIALSRKGSEAILREKINALMQSATTQPRFADYKSAMFDNLSESLKDVSVRIIEYLDRGFEESEEQIKTLEEQIKDLQGQERRVTRNKVRRMKSGLEIVRARYKDSGKIRVLEEIGQEKGVTRESIRQLEEKGLAPLLEQNSIQEILSLDFWDI